MNRIRQILTVVLAVAVPFMLSGCVTRKLWADKSHHPANPANLSLALDLKTRNVLVQYDEQVALSESVRRRAYWLFLTPPTEPVHGRPEFVSAKTAAGLTLIPILDEGRLTNNVMSTNGYVAVATRAQNGFDLWQDGSRLGHYYLPAYSAAPANTWRVLATPFTAITDAVIVLAAVAAVVALVGGIAYLESMSTASH